MDKSKSAIIFFLCASFVLLFTINAKSQDTEIDTLIKQVSVDSQKGAISSFTYLMKFSYERHKKFGGRKLTRLYEAILPSRFSLNRIYRHPFILLEDSEKIVTPVDIIEARKQIAKQLEKTENEEEKMPTNAENSKEDGGYWTMSFSANKQRIKIDVLELLKNSRLSNLQRKQIDGRNTVVIEFSPNPNAVFEENLSYLSKIEGQIWIDEADKRIVKIEGFAPGDFAKLKDKADGERQKGFVFLFSQTKVAEGFWFPRNVWLNFANHPEIFETIEVGFTFTNYKKASVDVKDLEEEKKVKTEADGN